MKKDEKNTGLMQLKSGFYSKNVKEIMDKINLSALSQVEKMEMENMFKDIIARSIAFDIDTFTRQMLVDKLKTIGKSLTESESDLLVLQEKLASMEQQIQFHKKILADLKERYVNSTDDADKRIILADIDNREKKVVEFNKMLAMMMEVRAKIRKEIDKKEFNEQRLKIQEMEGKGTGNIRDADFTILEDE